MTEHELPYSSELRRKALHLVALVIPLGMALLGRSASLLILVPITVIAVAADILRARSSVFAGWLYRNFGSMMRREEQPPIGSVPVFNGATWVMISATILTLVFPIAIAVPAFATFMVADAAAAVFGRRFGKHRWGSSSRTREGSTAFVVVGMLVMVAFPGISLWMAAAAVIPGAAAEIPSRPLNDNVRVPFVMAAVIALLHFLNSV